MTTLHDQLTALADSVEIPPAPTLPQLHALAPARRDRRPWIAAGVAAAVVATVGVVVWRSAGPDRAPDPADGTRWSDFDLPWTADGILHWGAAELPTTGLRGYAQTRDALYVLRAGTLSEVHRDGSVTELATDVRGPLAADPDGTVVAWADGGHITAYDGASGRREIDPAPQPDPQRMPLAVSGDTVYAIGSEDGFTFTLGADSGSAEGSVRTVLADARAGWTASFTGDGRVQVASPDGGLAHLGRRTAPSIGPDGVWVASVAGQGFRPYVTELATDRSVEVGIPAGWHLADFSSRWVGPGSLVLATTEAVDTPGPDDPRVTWQLCSAPDWGCTALGVPDQRRSQIAYAASFWNYVMIVDTQMTSSEGPAVAVGSGSASASAASEAP